MPVQRRTRQPSVSRQVLAIIAEGPMQLRRVLRVSAIISSEFEAPLSYVHNQFIFIFTPLF